MNQTFKAKRFQVIPLSSFTLAGILPAVTFYKGHRYNATVATNQPDWQAKGLVFVTKANGHEMLLRAGEYRVV